MQYVPQIILKACCLLLDLNHIFVITFQGSYTRGQMVIDHDNKLKRNSNVLIMTAVDKELYRRYLRMAFGGEF